MALVAADLKDKIKAATEGKTVAAEAMTAMGNAIADYVKANAEIAFGWIGALTVIPFTPDPVTTPKGKIISLTFSLTPSMATTQTDAFLILSSQLILGLTAAMYNITDPGFVTSPGSMATSPTIAIPVVITVSGSDRDSALLQFSDSIINWIKMQIPLGPISGTHAAYTGVGIATGIS